MKITHTAMAKDKQTHMYQTSEKGRCSNKVAILVPSILPSRSSPLLMEIECINMPCRSYCPCK